MNQTQKSFAACTFLTLEKYYRMIESFPYEYTLETGTKVVVNKSGNSTYNFSLTPTEDAGSSFTYVEGERQKSEWDDVLEFEQLDALRAFWLKNEDIV